jgi:hypothetical protein
VFMCCFVPDIYLQLKGPKITQSYVSYTRKQAKFHLAHFLSVLIFIPHTVKMVHRQNVEVTNVERQNAEWNKMPNAKMLNDTKCRTDKISNDTKRRTDKILNVKKVEWDKTSNGTKCQIEITSNETKCRMGQNIE